MATQLEGTNNMGVAEFLSLFGQFSKDEQIAIAERISNQTFESRWHILDDELPDTDELTEEEIMAEVQAVRYGAQQTP